MDNFTVVYTDNITQQFEALRVTEKGVVIGRIIDGDFLDCGFIIKRNIKKILTRQSLESDVDLSNNNV